MRIWLKNLREKKQLSQQRVAEMAGLSQSYYAGIETGARGNQLPVDTAKKIADVLGFRWILFFENDEQAATRDAG